MEGNEVVFLKSSGLFESFPPGLLLPLYKKQHPSFTLVGKMTLKTGKMEPRSVIFQDQPAHTCQDQV